MDIGTPALLFPAVSLLFLAYTNRFLHLAALIRQLHQRWMDHGGDHLRLQINNLRVRLRLIRWMQLAGALSLVFCVCSMLVVLSAEGGWLSIWLFGAALVAMGISLVALLAEISLSGGALRILLNEVESGAEPRDQD
ncbi:MAG: DUF2721 domain-containing protein [Verrucomicrobiota bacterium]